MATSNHKRPRKNKGAFSVVGDEFNESELTSIKQSIKKVDLPKESVLNRKPQTQDKRVANGYQTGSKQVAEEVANGYQTGSKQVAETPFVSFSLIDQNPKQVAQRVAEEVANGYQTGSKQVAETPFGTLVGKERTLLLFIIEDCQINGDLKTAPLTLERISEALGCSSNRAKNVLHRLIEKSLIYRAEAKTGRGGWTQFGVSKDLFQKILLSETGSKGLANGYQTGSKQVAKRVAQRVADVPSSSSSYVLEELKTTTTGESDLVGFNAASPPSGWRDLDFSPLAEFGFTQSHLIQILKQGKLSETEVQDSVHFFAFDLNRNGKGSELNGSPLNFFMGILRKGTPYAPPANYESPADEARRKIREFKEKKQQERLAEEEKILNLEFNEWRRGLSETQASKLVPEFARKPGPLHDSALKTHFENHVWPSLQNGPFEGEAPLENTNQPINEPSSPVV